jgi:hypothetical protein
MDDFKPSVFTPFARRFTDERARDLADTKELYARVRARHLASRFADAAQANLDIGREIFIPVEDDLSEPVKAPVCGLIDGLLQSEKTIFEFPAIDLDRAHLSLKELVDLRHFLRAKEHFHAHEERVTSLLVDCLSRITRALTDMLPLAFAPSPFTIPLVYLLPNPKGFIDNLLGEFWQQRYVDNGLFVEVSRQMYFNNCEASGIADPNDPKKPLKKPSQSDEPLDEIVELYLKGTPFHAFFLAPVPLQFTYQERFSHMHVVGGSGAGKTTLLQNLILSDLASDEPPALVIVDSQTDLIRKLSRLALFEPGYGKLADRFLLISPRDIKHPPALNIFDVNRDRLGSYDEETKEQVTAGVIQTFDYLFEGLLGADLTAKQSVFFRFVARLLLALPETIGRSATILDMLALMDDAAPYQSAIQSLPPIQRQFFERDFKSKTFVQTKEQIRYRLNAILENPTLARLFTAPRNKIDLFTSLNDGAIVFVDTAKDFLKGASASFGRIFISLVLQAILERAAIPENRRRPTFLIVDEAAAYFDSNIDDLLTEARKYKLGCVFAHQFLDQATHSLRASLAANTAIKMASGVSTSDARALAPDMRTNAEFVLEQPKLSFACHIRGVTPNAVSVPVAFGLLDRQLQMDESASKELQERNRANTSLAGEQEEVVRGDGFTARTTYQWDASSEHLRNHEFRPTSEPEDDPTKPSEEW